MTFAFERKADDLLPAPRWHLTSGCGDGDPPQRDLMYPDFSEVGLLESPCPWTLKEGGMPRSYPPEFRRKVLDLLAVGRSVTEVAAGLYRQPC